MTQRTMKSGRLARTRCYVHIRSSVSLVKDKVWPAEWSRECEHYFGVKWYLLSPKVKVTPKSEIKGTSDLPAED